MIKKINTTQRICPKCKGYFRHKGVYCSHRCERLSQPKSQGKRSTYNVSGTGENMMWRQYWHCVFSGIVPPDKAHLFNNCNKIMKTQKFENNKS